MSAGGGLAADDPGPADRRASRYRHGLQTAVGASAGPYGYTLSIWTSGAVLIHDDGLPSGGEALLFALGNVLAFALLGAIAFRRGRLDRGVQPRHPVAWGSFHFIPVGCAIGAATVIARAVDGAAAWPLAGIAVTSIYLALVGAQIAVFSQSPAQLLEEAREDEAVVRDEVEELLEPRHGDRT